MFDWISLSALGEGIYYFGFLVLIPGSIVLWARWRNWRLSRIDPPTPEELEEVEAMACSGSHRLRGRASAVSRHFGHSTKTDSDRNYGGTRNLHEATVVDSWRDDD